MAFCIFVRAWLVVICRALVWAVLAMFAICISHS
jgi:hypothetical protein